MAKEKAKKLKFKILNLQVKDNARSWMMKIKSPNVEAFVVGLK